VSPSARNHRAIAAYKKAGFHPVPTEKYHEFVKPEDMEYEDHVVLVKDYTYKNRFYSTGCAGA
jgi:RimJ/RimL family protein N-acetyltransferase